MKLALTISPWCMALALAANLATAQDFHPPKVVEAGSQFTIPTSGSGKAVLFIVSPAQALQREVSLGEDLVIKAGELYSAGHYLAVLIGEGVNSQAEFDVVPSKHPASLSFLAKPSRLAVNQPNGISGVVYVFDMFHNLLLEPQQVSFQLSETAGSTQTRTATTKNGVAWVRMNSAPKAGSAQFQASVGEVTDKRVLQQVAGDPCNLRMSAHREGQRVVLETAPIRDCNGNPVPDGTVVTFTQAYDKGTQSTVDVPIKRGIARTDMPARNGAVISIATGVVIGNEIRLGSSQ